MVIKRFLLLSGVVSLLLLNASLPVKALTGDQNSLPGASNAADYQPPTGNPQNDVGGVSQGQNNQNDLQKPGTVDQTALPNVPDLRVPGVTGETNSNTTKTEVTQDKGKKSAWAYIMLAIAVVAAAVLVLTSGKARRTKDVPTPDQPEAKVTSNPVEAAATETADDIELTNSLKPSEPAAKKATKRKKGKNKKTKRKR